MEEKKLKELIKLLTANQQLINRRKIEETFTENYGEDFSLFTMLEGTSNLVEYEDETRDDQYYYLNHFYTSDRLGDDTFVLKVGFQRNNNGKRGYTSGFSVYLVRYDEDGEFHFMPALRVDLEDPIEKGEPVYHKNEYPEDLYSKDVYEVYKKFFSEEEPAPHIHFFNDKISEEYVGRNGNDSKDKNINGNAISLDHLLDYFCKLADIYVKKAEGKELTEEEQIIDSNDFGMPYLKLVKEKKMENYVTNVALSKKAISARFEGTPVFDKIQKELDFKESELYGLGALIFDIKCASVLSELLLDKKYQGHHAAIKDAITGIMTKASMQLCKDELDIEDKSFATLGVIDRESWKKDSLSK